MTFKDKNTKKEKFYLNYVFMVMCSFRKLANDNKKGVDKIDNIIIKDRERRQPLLGIIKK